MTDRLKKEEFVRLLATRTAIASAFWLVIDVRRKTLGTLA